MNEKDILMSKGQTLGTRSRLESHGRDYTVFRLPSLEKQGIATISRLPYSIRVLAENLLRQAETGRLDPERAVAFANWKPRPDAREIPYLPARVILQDFTGVPVVVDLVAMRGAVHLRGGDPKKINPVIPVDLVIDHSVQVDFSGVPDAVKKNVELEFKRNRERYAMLRWAQRAFGNFRVVPPGTGIVHQVNLEYLASVVQVREQNGEWFAYPDTLIGTDSHTTMINGLGVLGWGVGGIEAEAVMLGQPYFMLPPEVIGVRLHGKLIPGTTATDLVLAITQRLRQKGVVGKFVEYYGPGIKDLSLEDRATLSNMSPEYGATMGFFPVDERTLEYLRFTGRDGDRVDLVETYCKEQGLFHTADAPEPEFTETLDFDLASVEPSLAGPKRPHDRVPMTRMKDTFEKALRAPFKERGFELKDDAVGRAAKVRMNSHESELRHGSVIIASITSCTNTSNPAVMLAAGLLARKAVKKGLRVEPYVKTSLAPGSRVVTDYLEKSGLLRDLEQLNFHVVGYGCTVCIGNSGPVFPPVAKAVAEADLVAASVLSGNRNFEARINPSVKANYLASPPLVVAYALAGRVDIDLDSEPLGKDQEGNPVYLRDIWPSQEEVRDTLRDALSADMYSSQYAEVFEGDDTWRSLPIPDADIYEWDQDSTYIQEPPYFEGMPDEPPPIGDITGARVLGVFGDTVTTDHISPAGSIPANGPAGKYLIEHGVPVEEFNTFGSRRGNHEVMIRGTFANIRIKNLLLPGTEGGVTLHIPSGEKTSIFEASIKYLNEGTPLLVIAGKEYGTGSSRDWAAKGTALLGVRAVLAESFERIHRSNLVGMGVLPIQFRPGENRESLGLTGKEVFDIVGLSDLAPGKELTVQATLDDGSVKQFKVKARVDTPVDVEQIRHGGILPLVARKLA